MCAAADGCSGTPAVTGAGASVQPHGCAAHHPGRCREHDRRLRVRLPEGRQQISHDRARGVPARGARHRPQQVQLRRRRALRDSRGHRKRRREGPHNLLLSVQVRHDIQEPQHDPAVVPRRDRQRRRRLAESHPAIYGRQGRWAHRRTDAARARHRAAQQPGERHAEVQPRQRRRTAREGRRGERGRLDCYTAQSIAELDDGYLRLRGPAGRRVLCRHTGRSSIC